MKNNDSLSSLISQEIKKSHNPSIWRKIKLFFSDLYVPSWKSFLLTFSVIGIFCILSWTSCQFFNIEDAHHQNLIAILAGVGTMIFALIIFVAESLRDTSSSDKARVLLRESFLFPLSVGSILAFFSFIFQEVTLWSLIPIFLIAGGTIRALWVIMGTLLDKNLLLKKRMSLFRDRIRQNIDLAVKERIGVNIFLKRLDSESFQAIQYSPYQMDETNNAIKIVSNSAGIIFDIDFKKLEKISLLLREMAEKKGRAYTDSAHQKSLSLGSTDQAKNLKEVQYEDSQLQKRERITKKYGDWVTENDTLIIVDKSLIDDEKILNKISNLCHDAFKIKDSESFSEIMRNELSELKDVFFTAISNHHLGKIAQLKTFYIEISEVFLEQISIYGGPYHFSDAVKERNSLEGNWEIISWLKSYIREIFDFAVKTESRNIIREVCFLPIMISTKAIHKLDHFLFQEFIWFPEVIYRASLKVKDNELKEFMMDRSWRYLKEIADYHIESELRKSHDTNKQEQLNWFAIYFYLIFQNLMKHAFDEKDLESFKIFSQATNKLFDYSDNLHEKKDYFTEIHGKREQMVFGLCGHILDKYKRNPEDETLKEFSNLVLELVPNNLKSIANLFLETKGFDCEGFWGWGWWDLKSDGEAHTIDFQGKLETLFVIKSLQIISKSASKSVEAIELPYDRDLSYLIGENKSLNSIINYIKADAEKWSFCLEGIEDSHYNSLLRLLENAKAAQNKDDLDNKRKLHISEVKVSKFKNIVYESFRKSSSLRNLLINLDLYEASIDKKPPNECKRFGFKIADEKAAFFEEWHVGYSGWGENYGRGLASSENTELYKLISDSCEEKEVNELEKLILNLGENSKDYIIVTSIWRLDGLLSKITYLPKWNLEKKEILEIDQFNGYFVADKIRIPVFNMFLTDNKETLLVLNKNKLGVLKQYNSAVEGGNVEMTNELFIDVKEFLESNLLLKQYLEAPPSWLEKFESEEDKTQHLQEKVLVEVFEKYEFNLDSSFEGYISKLNQ
ncbi:MAG: hypothetical protein GY730_06320 [bacterium]|nr:hypothetical protein [bacterium]